jgi:1-acyl-sn-glycerol-3-phosphate acyltransferase
MKILRSIRAKLGLALLVLFMLCTDLVHRILVAPACRLRPAAAIRWKTRWTTWISGSILRILRLVGVSIELSARISGTPDTLILMNHQSILDIPIAFQVVRGRYPRIVTRDRYGRGIPLVSVLLKDLGCPLVSPGSGNRKQFQELTELAQATENPVLIYPEGTRSRTGEPGPFRRAGLQSILAAKRWNVFLVAVDGLWRAGKLADLPGALVGLRGQVAQSGPFPGPAPGEDTGPFIARMEDQMSLLLQKMRDESPA